MCLIGVNTIADRQLSDLEASGDKDMIEKRMFCFANEAGVGKPGALDGPNCHMKRMPPELRHIRKRQIGRHRVFYTGDFNQCNYLIFYIKKFKKSGVDEEDDRGFQGLLIRFLQQQQSRTIESS